MKNSYKYLIIIVLVGLGFVACDKIEPPYKQGSDGPAVEQTRKVLLEDYTGHTCVNCPTAAKKAVELVNLYEGKLILMAIHAGYFAEPKAAPFNNDYRTEAGNAWDTFFGMSAAGNPIGMVNRQKTQGVYTVENGDWGSSVAAIIEDKASIQLEIVTDYNATNRSLKVDLQAKITQTLDPALKIIACVVEDSIVSAQRNNDTSLGGATITDYVHRHVLRESLNGSWGEDLAMAGQSTTGAEFTKSYTNSLSSIYNVSHVSIIAFVYNADTYEILQVEEKHIQK